jgi:ADP-ribose pyrophosphatase YjhB (NUDIX family)
MLPLLSSASLHTRETAARASWAIELLLGRALRLLYTLRRLGWRITRPVTLNARVLVVAGEEVLLVRVHGSSFWHLPGGGVKRHESLAEAAVREVREETSCQVQIERLLGMYSHDADYKSEQIAIFVARPVSEVRVRRNLEIAEARFFPLTALPVQLFPSVRARLAEYQAGYSGVIGTWGDERYLG